MTTGERPSPSGLRRVRFLVIVALVVLTAQGWTGDFVNLFAVFSVPTDVNTYSMGWLVQALLDSGVITVYHAFEGALLLVLSIVILALSFRSTGVRSVRFASFMATAAIISAALGGVLFVFSGYTNNANSAQMGGSFIGAYAFYFLQLYFMKDMNGTRVPR